MHVYFVRHGIAEARMQDGSDDPTRALTEQGAFRVKQIAKWLRRMGVEIDLVVSSPLVRARQTAQILHDRLLVGERLLVDERLSLAFDAERLAAIIRERSGAGSLMLVGHEPSLSMVVGEITGGSRLNLRKGGIALVEIGDVELRAASLEWLITPRLVVGRKKPSSAS